MEQTRQATHAGTWYSSNPSQLNSQLTSWLQSAEATHSNVRVLIAPHAGYTYSGPTAAWSYIHIVPSSFTRVFLLGPSHHFYLSGCALPNSRVYDTPLGPIPVDTQIVQRLYETGRFRSLTQTQEEDEHSLEMHLPYIRKVFENRNVLLVPIMVGQMENEEVYGGIFAEYLRNSENLFIVSSDFCHWGQRFGFTPYDRNCGEVWQSIEKMDREGMDFIEKHDLQGFKSYLARTKNTICGRNPIILMLSTILTAGVQITTKFVKYSQSEKVRSQSDSSVSYASSVSGK